MAFKIKTMTNKRKHTLKTNKQNSRQFIYYLVYLNIIFNSIIEVQNK